MKKNSLIFAIFIFPFFIWNNSYAADGSFHLDNAKIDLNDQHSLQRGARNFINYCLNCHSANYMRYNRLQDIGLSEDEIKKNLLFTADKSGELMNISMDSVEAKKVVRR